MARAVRLVTNAGAQLLGRRSVIDDDEQIDVAIAPGGAARPRTKQDDPLRFEIIDHRIKQVARDAGLPHRAILIGIAGNGALVDEPRHVISLLWCRKAVVAAEV
jgi:hypothetical protein